MIATSQPDSVALAAAALGRGEVIGIPTDTVYGVAMLAGDDAAVQRCFAVKERPPDRPLPVFPVSLARVADVADLGPIGGRLAGCFWPGALTIVAPVAAGFSSAALLGQRTVGVRLPAHPWVLELLGAVGRPLAVTSANRSGAGSVATAEEVVKNLDGLVPLVVDGGPAGGTESTVVDITRGLEVLRAGAIGLEALQSCLAGATA